MNNDNKYHLEQFSKTDEDFDDFYEKELKSKVAILEKERQKTVQLVKKQIIKFIIPIIIVIILLFFYKEVLLFSIPVIVFMGGYLFKDIKKERNELLKKIKEEIVTDLIYFMNGKFTIRLLKNNDKTKNTLR